MTLTERAAYLQGLMEGMNLDATSDNGKLFRTMADLLTELSLSVEDLEEKSDIMGQELDIIEEALDEIDEVIDEMDETLDDLYEDDDYEYDDEYGFDDDEFYQVVCPTCGEEISVDDGILEQGQIKCPACGEDLEFDVSDLECDCGCGCDKHE